jgi:hypothetical protein
MSWHEMGQDGDGDVGVDDQSGLNSNDRLWINQRINEPDFP